MARKTWRINLQLDADLEPIVRQAAGARNLTVTAYINQVLIEHAPADMDSGYAEAKDALKRLRQQQDQGQQGE